jgi:hypothetical protein
MCDGGSGVLTEMVVCVLKIGICGGLGKNIYNFDMCMRELSENRSGAILCGKKEDTT